MNKASNVAPLPAQRGILGIISGTDRNKSGGFENGTFVKALQTGDIEGHSPSYLCIDDQGRSAWVSFDNVRITDPDILPHNREHYARTFQNTEGGRSVSGTSSGR